MLKIDIKNHATLQDEYAPFEKWRYETVLVEHGPSGDQIEIKFVSVTSDRIRAKVVGSDNMRVRRLRPENGL